MPWKATSTMSLRYEFVLLARQPEANVSELCRQYGISRKTGYKWLERFAQGGPAGLEDRARRPHHSPHRTPEAMAQRVVAARQQHPSWSGHKLKAWLEQQGVADVPAASTITAILARHGLVDPQVSPQHTPYQRFEMSAPNELLQMDFKGDFALATGQRCHPLTVLDDHSRFLLGLWACADQTHATVQAHLTTLFRQYGLPARRLMDNGPPWGDPGGAPYTHLTVWLLRLGIAVSHGRPFHPQTQGKDERLHRTLRDELLDRFTLIDLDDSQRRFDPWRTCYNLERPHEALGQQPPITRYRPSPRPFPDPLPPLDYPPTDPVRQVDAAGKISFRNRAWRIGRAFRGYPVGLRPDPHQDGLWQVFFGDFHIAHLDFRTLS
jgi:transposase InsO family protein